MSYLQLKWVAESTPGQSTNPYVHPKIKSDIDHLTKRAESLMALTPMLEVLDQANEEIEEVYHFGNTYMSVHIQTGERAKEILQWFRDHGYRSTRYSDDINGGSRDYTMVSRSDKSLSFYLYVYFKGETCKFVETEEVERTVPAMAATEEKVVYKRELQCGGVAIPEGV